MRTNLVLIMSFVVGACGGKKDDDSTAKAGKSGESAPTKSATETPPAAATPPKAAAGFTATKRDGTTKIGPLTFDHQVITDDGHGNHMVLLIANCPQITESCTIPKYLRENTELLDAKCPGWTEVAIAFGPKEQIANMGRLTVPTGKYSASKDQPVRAKMVELSDSEMAKAYKTMQLSSDTEPFVDITRSDGKGMAGTFSVKKDPAVIEGSFDAKACACDQNTGVCS